MAPDTTRTGSRSDRRPGITAVPSRDAIRPIHAMATALPPAKPRVRLVPSDARDSPWGVAVLMSKQERLPSRLRLER